MTKATARLGALLAMFTLFLAPGRADAAWTAPPANAFKVIEYNIGSGAECGGTEDCLAFLEQVVGNYHPDAIFGEEFCYSDYLRLKSDLQQQDAAWEVYWSTGTFHKQKLTVDPLPDDPTNGNGCPTPPGSAEPWEAKGIILAGLNLGTRSEYVLTETPAGTDPADPYDGQAKQTTLLCAIAPAAPTGVVWPTRLCVTHLAAGPDNATLRVQQLKKIQAYQEAWSRPAIGGDYNLALTNPDFVDYLNDTMQGPLAGLGNGAAKLVDPQSTSYVDHNTFRRRAGMTTSAQAMDDQSLNYSTHKLQRAWVAY